MECTASRWKVGKVAGQNTHSNLFSGSLLQQGPPPGWLEGLRQSQQSRAHGCRACKPLSGLWRANLERQLHGPTSGAAGHRPHTPGALHGSRARVCSDHQAAHPAKSFLEPVRNEAVAIAKQEKAFAEPGGVKTKPVRQQARREAAPPWLPRWTGMHVGVGPPWSAFSKESAKVAHRPCTNS